jgi:hypothetical protein
MYKDVKFLIHACSRHSQSQQHHHRPPISIHHEDSTPRSPLQLVLSEQEEKVRLKRVKMYSCRSALAALSAIQKMLNIVVYPLFLCKIDSLIYLGCLVALYEALYLLGGGILVPAVEGRWGKVGITVLRCFAVCLAVAAWIMCVFCSIVLPFFSCF